MVKMIKYLAIPLILVGCTAPVTDPPAHACSPRLDGEPTFCPPFDGDLPLKPLIPKQELATPIYWYDNVGRRVLESKDQIKKRLQGAGSPDLADALALTFALPVAKKQPEDIYIKRRKAATQKTDYDPYKVLSL